ncbi:MAG TPA: hypothetical protein VKV33_09425 [Streptosporangiaceae bacterium]|nr:hypothetical protein [Streptosporangiaceae bacterium]
MPASAFTGRRPAGRKSPLRVATETRPFTPGDQDQGPAAARGGPGRREGLSPRDLRRLMISEYRDWLRSRTSRDGRPFQEDTVPACADAAIALDAWMTREDLPATSPPAARPC